jgi:hypothetical protein
MYYLFKTILWFNLVTGILFIGITYLLGGIDSIPEGYKSSYVAHKTAEMIIVVLCVGFLMIDAKIDKDK